MAVFGDYDLFNLFCSMLDSYAVKYHGFARFDHLVYYGKKCLARTSFCYFVIDVLSNNSFIALTEEM